MTGEANPFLYTRNSPTNATDPSGHFLVFSDKKQADEFVSLMRTKYGAKHAYVVQGEKQTYVSFDPRDTMAVGRYADEQWPNMLKHLPEEKADIEAGERRNRFLVASGIFGTAVGRFGTDGLDDKFFGNIKGDDTDVDFASDVGLLHKMIASIESCGHPVVLNIGGEDNDDDPKGVINININIKGIGDGDHRISNLFLRPQYKSRFTEIPDMVADEIFMRATPSSPTTAKEIARMIKAQGKITFITNNNDSCREFIDDIVTAIEARVENSGGRESFTKKIGLDSQMKLRLDVTLAVKPGTVTSPSKLLASRIEKDFKRRFGDPLSLTSKQYQELSKLHRNVYLPVFDSLEKMGFSTQGSVTALLDAIQTYNKTAMSKLPAPRGPADTSFFTVAQLESYYKYYSTVLNAEANKDITSDEAKKLERLQPSGDPKKDKLVDLEGTLKQLGSK